MPPQPISFSFGVQLSQCPILADFDTDSHVRDPNTFLVDDHGE